MKNDYSFNVTGSAGSAAGIATQRPDMFDRGCENQAERNREIPTLLNHLHKTVETTSEAFARLQGRLGGLLPPMPPYDKLEGRCAITSLGSSLAELLTRVELLELAISRVSEALEI